MCRCWAAAFTAEPRASCWGAVLRQQLLWFYDFPSTTRSVAQSCFVSRQPQSACSPSLFARAGFSMSRFWPACPTQQVGESRGRGRRLFEYPLDRWDEIAGSKLRLRDFLVAVIELAGVFWRYTSAAQTARERRGDSPGQQKNVKPISSSRLRGRTQDGAPMAKVASLRPERPFWSSYKY